MYAYILCIETSTVERDCEFKKLWEKTVQNKLRQLIVEGTFLLLTTFTYETNF